MIEVVKDVWFKDSYQQIAASGEVAVREFDLHVGKSGRRWLVARQKNAADNVYVEGGKGSQGFGGRKIPFKLADGSVLELVGPWHSHAGALRADTGVDVTDRHHTQVILIAGSRYREEGKNQNGFPNLRDGYKDVYVYRENVLGEFSGGREFKQMAKDLATQLGHTVYLYTQTYGGSSCSPVDPEGMGFTPMP